MQPTRREVSAPGPSAESHEVGGSASSCLGTERWDIAHDLSPASCSYGGSEVDTPNSARLAREAPMAGAYTSPLSSLAERRVPSK